MHCFLLHSDCEYGFTMDIRDIFVAEWHNMNVCYGFLTEYYTFIMRATTHGSRYRGRVTETEVYDDAEHFETSLAQSLETGPQDHNMEYRCDFLRHNGENPQCGKLQDFYEYHHDAFYSQQEKNHYKKTNEQVYRLYDV